MKKIVIALVLTICSFFHGMADRYVSLPGGYGTNNPPYTNWADAATNIQWAVDVATNNETVWVTNGPYVLTNQIVITNAIVLKSVNGRAVTVINGNLPINTNGCLNLTKSGAILDGFTITNGGIIGNGGGVIGAAGTTVKNCLITGCMATNAQGSLSLGGGAYINGVITNCEIIGNISYNSIGGGICLAAGAAANFEGANNMVGAHTPGANAYGGGIYAGSLTLIDHCLIYANGYTNCWGGGVIFSGGNGGTIRNSLVYNNQAMYGGGIYGYNNGITIPNCTVASNTATAGGGGITLMIKPATTSCVQNVISYFNAGSGSNIYFYTAGGYTGSCLIVNSCIAPTNAFQTSGLEGYYYANNIEANPQFVDKNAGNWRLNANSPCINSGTNQAWMTNAVDLDGRMRIRYGVVDMGAHETIYEGTIYKFGF